MKKHFLFRLHALTGLLSGCFIFLLSFSGTLLVFHDELDAFQQPIVGYSNENKISIDSCYKIVRLQYPGAVISNCNIPVNTSSCYIFALYDPSFKEGKEALEVYLHPLTGLILKKRGSKDLQNDFMGWLSGFHNSFHLGRTGEWLIGLLAIVFLLSLLTGIILFRKNIMAVLFFKKAVFRKNNLHQLIGVYALLFNLMMGFTGFWMQRYVFKKEFYSSQSYTPVIKPSPALLFSFDTSYKKIQELFPDFTGHVIYFAQGQKGKTAIYGSRAGNSFIHSKKYADVIILDSAGNIAKTAFVNDIDAASRRDIINAQIHYGQYGGLPVKILYSLLGLTSSLLSITGFFMWRKRRKITPRRSV